MKDGYNSISSALVDNDDDYSIIRWIQLNDFNCTSIADSTGNYDYYFWDTVPEWLIKHPLRNRTVCRKCHHECIGCFSNGYRLYENCKECRNFYSNSTNQCVNQCSNNEYLIQSSKVNINNNIYYIQFVFEPSFFVLLMIKKCYSCNNECSGGCVREDIYDCKDCRTLKLRLKDLNSTVAKVADKCGILNANFTLDNDRQNYINLANRLLKECSKQLDYENLFHLVESYRDYYAMRELDLSKSDESDVNFCVSGCPSQVPNPTVTSFCSKHK
jgi:hypothetical protein